MSTRGCQTKVNRPSISTLSQEPQTTRAISIHRSEEALITIILIMGKMYRIIINLMTKEL